MQELETEAPEIAEAHSHEPAQNYDLRALGADLSPDLDARLKQLIDAAGKRCRRRGVDVKRLLAAFVSGKATDAEFAGAIFALRSPGSAACTSQLCAWLLGVGELTSEQRQFALSALCDVVRTPPERVRRPVKDRLGRTLRLAGTGSLPIALIISIQILRDGAPWDLALFYWLTLSIMFSMVLLVPAFALVDRADARSIGRVRFLAAHTLGRLGSVEAIGALATAALAANTHLRRMALTSLHVLLPRLTTADYGRLGSEVVPTLCRLLRPGTPSNAFNAFYEVGHNLRLLEALKKIGDSRAIPSVRNAASRWPDGLLTETAKQVLAVLEERAQREIERATLLRGSEPARHDDELLLPSAGEAESRPEQLLRPVD